MNLSPRPESSVLLKGLIEITEGTPAFLPKDATRLCTTVRWAHGVVHGGREPRGARIRTPGLQTNDSPFSCDAASAPAAVTVTWLLCALH